MKRKKKDKVDQLLSEAFKDPRYSGKHIVIIGGKIYATKTGIAASKMLEKLLEKYPHEVPNVTYIPKAGTLILIS